MLLLCIIVESPFHINKWKMHKMLCELFLCLCYHSYRVQRSNIVLIQAQIQRLTNVYQSLEKKGGERSETESAFDWILLITLEWCSLHSDDRFLGNPLLLPWLFFFFWSVIRQNVLKSGWRFVVLLDFVNWWKWIFSSNQRALTTTIGLQQRNCSGVVYLQKILTITPHSGIKCNTWESFVTEQNTVQQAQTEVKNEWVWYTDHSQGAAVSSPNARSSPPSLFSQRMETLSRLKKQVNPTPHRLLSVILIHNQLLVIISLIMSK